MILTQTLYTELGAEGPSAGRAADPGPRLRHEIHPAQARLCQAQGIGRGGRDRPPRAVWGLAQG